MSNQINLLIRKTNDVNATLTKQIRVIRYIAMGLLIVVPSGVIVLFLLIYFSPLPTLQLQEKNLLSSTSLLQEQAAKVHYVNDRTLKIAQFIAKQTKYEASIQQIVKQLPSDVTITALHVEQNQITLNAQSPSLLSLQTFEDNLINNGKPIIKTVNFSTISAIVDAQVYSMSFTLNHE